MGDQSLPNWLLNFFHIPCGWDITLELYLSVHQTNKQANKFILEISFYRIGEEQEQENFVPHHIDEVRIAFVYVGPNQEYQDEEPAYAPSQILVESEDHDTPFHSVSGETPPDY